VLLLLLVLAARAVPAEVEDEGVTKLRTEEEEMVEDVAEVVAEVEVGAEVGRHRGGHHRHHLHPSVPSHPSHPHPKDMHVDVVVFTQQWPYTTCTDWERRRGGTCRRIDQPAWTVHGLWPNQFYRIAPGFCNSSWPFDVSQLKRIKEEMELYWPDVEVRGSPNSLWEHEWSKHGTCAVLGQVAGVTGQEGYFATGCRLARENPLSSWLEAANIFPSPDTRYTMEEVWEAVVEGAGTRPHIDCEKIGGQAYIKEVKVCYSPLLQRVDCDRIAGSREGRGGGMGSCSRWPDFLYPSSAPPGEVETPSPTLVTMVDTTPSTISSTLGTHLLSLLVVCGLVGLVLLISSTVALASCVRACKAYRSRKQYESV